MKFKIESVLEGTPKLLTAVALSALLVACGGGTSGDAADGGTTGVLDGVDAGGTDGESDADAGGTDGADEFADINGNGQDDELEACKGLGGTDPNSSNQAWNDNCHLQQDTDPDTAEIDKSPFSPSTYVLGVQRVLFCREYASVDVDFNSFAIGIFGPKTDQAVRDFQEAEGLIVDGVVGDATWGRMESYVSDVAVLNEFDDQYNGYGVVRVEEPTNLDVDCSGQTYFYGRINTDAENQDTFEGWEVAVVNRQTLEATGDKDDFSIDP